ncbi:uncharacterized protein METZ01_LOCUS467152, partial [marine metagenome]
VGKFRDNAVNAGILRRVSANGYAVLADALDQKFLQL